MREMANKWDREFSEECVWPNPYRVEEDYFQKISARAGLKPRR
jgi:hypothetical protein